MTHTLYDFEVQTLQGQPCPLSTYRGRVVLIVNVASKCGFTPQYRELQALHERWHTQGLTILGFPCNQFGGQEPGDADEIASFCNLDYGVSFQMCAKVEVNGADADPLFAWLRQSCPGLLGTQAIKWNFTKFLVNRHGQPVSRHAPATRPAALEAEIERLLAETV